MPIYLILAGYQDGHKIKDVDAFCPCCRCNQDIGQIIDNDLDGVEKLAEAKGWHFSGALCDWVCPICWEKQESEASE